MKTTLSILLSFFLCLWLSGQSVDLRKLYSGTHKTPDSIINKMLSADYDLAGELNNNVSKRLNRPTISSVQRDKPKLLSTGRMRADARANQGKNKRTTDRENKEKDFYGNLYEIYNKAGEVSIGFIPRRVKSLVPSIYNLSDYLCYIGDQGNVWSCTAWAAASMKSIENAITKKIKFSNLDKTDKASFLSPSFIFQKAKERFNPPNNDCKFGINLPEALVILMDEGVPSLDSCPYYSPSSVCPKLDLRKFDSIAKNNRINNFRPVPMNVLKFQDAINHNYAIMVEANIDNQFMVDGLTGKWTDEKPFIWTKTSGGFFHTMLCIGYSDNKGAFLMVNSHGTKFGCSGFFWIKYDFMFEAIDQAYRIESDQYIKKSIEEETLIKKVNTNPGIIINHEKLALKMDNKEKSIIGVGFKFLRLEKIIGGDIAHLQIRNIENGSIIRQDFPISTEFCKYFSIGKNLYFITLNTVTNESIKYGFLKEPFEITLAITKTSLDSLK